MRTLIRTIFIAASMLLGSAVRAATTQPAQPAAMYTLTTQPTVLANKGLAPGLGQDGVNISGRYHVIENVTITGGMHGLKFDGGASDITIVNCVIRNPVPSGGGGYCVYSSNGKGLSERIDFINCTFEIDESQQFAQMDERAYGVRWRRYFNCKFINRGKALKASYKLGDGKHVEFYDCAFTGWPPGICRNPNDPDTYLVEDVKMVRCTIDMNTATTAHAPSFKIAWARDVTIKDCAIAQRANVGVLDIGDGVDGLRFIGCTIVGGSRLGTRGPRGAAVFENSTYLGKPIVSN